jgi:hypothetical protein
MVLTKQQKRAALQYIIQTVLDQDADSNIAKAFLHNDIQSPHNIMLLSNDNIPQLDYPSKEDQLITLKKGNIGLIRAFRAFVLHRTVIGSSIEDLDWITNMQDKFDRFQISPNNPTMGSTATPAYTPQLAQAPSAPYTFDPVAEFCKGIKREISHFIPLKDELAWDNWNQATIAQA